MDTDFDMFLVLAEAIGIGLLVGIERERSTAQVDGSTPAGVRTFALASLIGAVSMIAGGVPLLIASAILVGAARIVSMAGQGDRTIGATTTLALLLVVLLGALATQTAFLAASIAVVVASLLAARQVLRDFSRTILTEAEVRDGLILGVAVLVVLPVLPNRDFGPGGTLNPRELFLIVVMIMVIGAAGHIATRTIGPRFGLPVSGFLSGFVSSTATILALGQRSAAAPNQTMSSAAGAALSSVSSLIQVGIILLVLSPAMFAAGLPLLLATVTVAAVHGATAFLLSLRGTRETAQLELARRVFSVSAALGFAALVAIVTIAAAILNDLFGNTAVLASVTLAGLASTNSAAVALASLVAAGQIGARDAILPLAAAIAANTLVRMWIAARVGAPTYRSVVFAGLFVQVGALWLVWRFGDVGPEWIGNLDKLRSWFVMLRE